MLVPILILGLLAGGFLFWRRRRRNKTRAASQAYGRWSRPPRGDAAYQDSWKGIGSSAVTPSSPAAGKHTWREKFLRTNPLSAPSRAVSTRQLGENDDGAFGGYATAGADSYQLQDQSAFTMPAAGGRRVTSGRTKRDKTPRTNSGTWSEFGLDDGRVEPVEVEEYDEDDTSGTLQAPGSIHHRRLESAASGSAGRPISTATARGQSGLDLEDPQSGAQNTTSFFLIDDGDDEAAEGAGPGVGRKRSDSTNSFGVKRKPVPSFSAARDASAAYSAAETSGIDSNPFADPQAPASAFTVRRHAAASDGAGAFLGKPQHTLDVATPI